MGTMEHYLDELELTDTREFEQEYGTDDDVEPVYSVYAIYAGSDNGTWHFYFLRNAYAAYLTIQDYVKSWTDEHELIDGDGVYLYDTWAGEIIAGYRMA